MKIKLAATVVTPLISGLSLSWVVGKKITIIGAEIKTESKYIIETAS